MKNVLCVKNLCVGYREPILNDISFDVNQGEIVGFLGLNGSGKSTLLGGLCGINKVFSGEIFVKGTKINSLSSKKRAQYISYYTQRTPKIEGLTVRQVIELGCYSKSTDLLSVIYDKNKTEITNKCAKLLKIENLLDTDILKLSEGQRSLAFLAKIFAQDTPIVLLDEPDNNLDFLNTHNLFTTFKNQISNKNKSAIIVLHNPTLALNYCNRLFLISDGKIIGETSTQNDSIETMQEILRLIYPDIIIGRDDKTSSLYTVF